MLVYPIFDQAMTRLDAAASGSRAASALTEASREQAANRMDRGGRGCQGCQTNARAAARNRQEGRSGAVRRTLKEQAQLRRLRCLRRFGWLRRFIDLHRQQRQTKDRPAQFVLQ